MIKVFEMKKLVRIGAITCLMFLFTGASVNAAAIIDIEVPDEIKKGETHTVNVTFVDNNIGEIKAQIEYDSAKIEYLSGGSSEGNTGLVLLNGNGYGNSKAIFNIKFKGLEPGESNLKVTTSEIYNLDGESLGAPTTEIVVTVINSDGTSGQSSTSDNNNSGNNNDKGESDNAVKVASSSFFSSPESVYVVGLIILVVLLSVTLTIISIRRRKKIKRLKEEENLETQAERNAAQEAKELKED